jgi:hypothetical protein
MQSVRRATGSKCVGTLRSSVEVIDMPKTIGHGDPLYLFLCHLEWRRTGNVAAYQELLAALEDTDRDLCVVAEVLLQDSPHPEPTSTIAEAW